MSAAPATPVKNQSSGVHPASSYQTPVKKRSPFRISKEAQGIDRLPADAWQNIIDCLTQQERSVFGLTCKRFNSTVMACGSSAYAGKWDRESLDSFISFLSPARKASKAVFNDDSSFIQIIDLTECGDLMDDDLTRIVTRCPRLKRLNLMECGSMTNAGLQTVAAHCPELEYLGLSGCEENISDEGIQFIGNRCHKLKELDLSYCSRVTSEGIGAIAEGCPELERLCLTKCTAISSAGLQVVAAHCKDFKSLKIENSEQVDDAFIGELTGFDALEHLDISCTGISDEGLDHLPQFPQLNSIRLMFCPGLTDAGIGRLCTRFKDTLRYLDLSEHQLTSIESFAQLEHLEELNLSCLMYTNPIESFAPIAQLRNLQKLLLGNSDNLLDEDIEAIAPNNPGLREVDLRGAFQLTERAAFALAEHCQDLEVVDLSQCNNISYNGVKAIVELCPNLRELWIVGLVDVNSGGHIPEENEKAGSGTAADVAELEPDISDVPSELADAVEDAPGNEAAADPEFVAPDRITLGQIHELLQINPNLIIKRNGL